jgi:uncharacterized protein (DUF1800 family)
MPRYRTQGSSGSRAPRAYIPKLVAFAATLAAALCFASVALAQSLSPVYRFYNLQRATHFYTISASERDYVIATYPTVFVYEGPVFSAYTTPAPGAVGVTRFYNLQTGTHFYTINPDEIAYILAHYPQFVYEGVVYYVPPVMAPDGRSDLFRFYNNLTGTHFFTNSVAERDHVIATYPQFVYEGTVYYVYSAAAGGTPPPIGGANPAPVVSLVSSSTNPAVPGAVTLTATAVDSDGISKVMFYQGTTLLATLTAPPYTYVAQYSVSGDYNYSAVAVDTKGLSGTSNIVTVHAGITNVPPTVALAASTTTVTAPGQVILTANASDSDGQVVMVSIYQGPTKLVDLTTPPYVYTVSLANAGDFPFTALATDDKGGTGLSAPVSVHVNPATPPPPPGSPSDVYRLLNQATFGFTQAEAARVTSMGVSAWIDDQFTKPVSGYPDTKYTVLQLNTSATCTNTDPVTMKALPANDPRNICYRDNLTPTGVQRDFFTNAVSGADQLRQRVAWALSQILVISTVDRDLSIAYPMTRYQNILFNNAFGNFETLLNQITLSPSMGYWLTMINNDKGNPATGREPNQNYAREIMQLFSIGLIQLTAGGDPILDATGQPVPTYDQNTIAQFANVFTGWTYPKPGVVTTTKNPPDYEVPMVTYVGGHETAAKTLLPGPNQNIPANQTAQQDITAAVHNIFMHPNVGPFIGRQLIQHLVTSNPSSAYVSRVTAVFNNDGQGVRGNMQAVVKAILMDPEARGGAAPDTFGQLREPVLMMTAILRGLSVATDGAGLSARTSPLGQPVYSSPTVFNYYPIDYTIPNTSLDGPEFGNHNSYTAVQRQNQVYSLVYQGIAIDPTVPNAVGTIINLAPYQALAANPAAMVDALNQALMGGTLPANAATIIVNSVTQVPVANTLERAKMAIYQMASSFHFQVQH